MPSSWILRVMVLRPIPSRLAASMRRPPLCASAFDDQRALELPPERIQNSAFAPRKAPLDFVCKRVEPVGLRDRRGLSAELGRQVAELDRLPGRHHRQPMAEVLELAHIARKIEPPEVLDDGVGQALGFDAQLFRAAREEVPRQQRNVLAPLAQRRHADADHVQAMVEILAEAAFAHARLEVLVGGGDDAHIRLDLLVAADPVEAALREHPQQPGLQLCRHVADFVQEQSAALGLLEPPAALLLGAGEGAPLVAEQL